MSKISRAYAQMQGNKQTSGTRSESRGTSKSKGQGSTKGARSRSRTNFDDDLPGVSLHNDNEVEAYMGGSTELDAAEQLMEDSENRQESLRRKETTGTFTRSLRGESTNSNVQKLKREATGTNHSSPLQNIARNQQMDNLHSTSSVEAAGAVRNVARSRFAKAMLEKQSSDSSTQEAANVTNRKTTTSFDDDLPRVGLVKDKS